MYFVPLLKGARGQKTRMMGLLGREKNFDDIFSCLDTMHQRDRQTDVQTDRQTNGHQTRGDSKDRAYA